MNEFSQSHFGDNRAMITYVLYPSCFYKIWALCVVWIYLNGSSEQNSVVLGSSTTQTSFLQLLLKIFQSWIPYVSIQTSTNMITCATLGLTKMWRLTKAKTKMKREHWTKRQNYINYMKFIYIYIYIYIYNIYVYKCIFMIHKVFKSFRSKMGITHM